ncbi:MAG: PEGA domain-containing protein [Methanoregula sp.]|nr:PEGA domain-containing protein [Methanoregula sp.]
MIIIILVLCAICTIPVSADFSEIEEPTEPTTMPTFVTQPTTVPTTEPTRIPTTEPTAIPTEPPTTVPTTVPTKGPTTNPTTMPTFVTPPTTVHTTEPTRIPTTEITITIEPTFGGGKGWIDTYCNVDGATVYFDGSPQGNIAGGILSVGVSPTGSPVRTISVSKTGYTTWSGPLSHMPESEEHVAVYATINPIATPTTVPPVQNGAIYAQSSPSGAAIYMNGNYYGYAPVTIPNLPPGSYSMKATLNGYSPDSQLVNVYAGQTAAYYPTLQQSPPPPRSTGTVYARSSPSGAYVYVDGTYNGVTPITLTLFPGNRNIVLKLSGYNDWSTSVYVSAGSSQTINPGLTSAIFGSLSIGSAPSGASVFMDSAYQGITNPSGGLTLNNIQSGSHIIKVTASGYNDWIETVYVKPNANTYVPVAMTRIGPSPTPVPAAGAVNIVSTPAGAEILIDNIFRGYTPATITEIDPGVHKILLTYTGYTAYSGTVTVVSGQTTPLAIGMTPVPTPTPQSATSPALLIGGLVTILGIVIGIRRRS